MAEGNVMLTWEFRDLPGMASKDKTVKAEKRKEDMIDVGEKLLGIGEETEKPQEATRPATDDGGANLVGLAKVAQEFELAEQGRIQIVELSAIDEKEGENKPPGWKLTLSVTKEVKKWSFDKHTRMLVGVAKAIRQLTEAKFVNSVKDGTAK